MDILFLGTSSGVPTNARNVSAIALIETRGRGWHLIDCGEGTQHQIMRSELSINSLMGIYITHLHGDHCYGLPGLLASASLGNRTEPLSIIGPESLQEWLDITMRISDLYLTFEINFAPVETLSDFELGDFEKLKEMGLPQGPLWGQLKSGADVEHEGKVYRSQDFVNDRASAKKVLICGDNDQPDLVKAHCGDCDVLVHESTFDKTMAEQAKKVGHSYAELVALFAEENTIPNLVLTHISARYRTASDGTGSIELIRNEAERVFSGNLHIANDFDRFRLGKSGLLDLI